MRRWIFVVAACIAVGATACGEAPTSRHVLVIGIDGVRPDVLRDVPTPNLDALAQAGVLRDDAKTGLPTVSGPGWSSFLTGVWPKSTVWWTTPSRAAATVPSPTS